MMQAREMKAMLLNENGEEAGEVSIPPMLTNVEVDELLIRRAFVAAFSRRFQPQGRDTMAGKRTTAESWGADHGVARVPRTERSEARFAPMTVKGRLAHPPRVEKKIEKKINRKEYRKAFLSALSAVFQREAVEKRGHRLGSVKIPVVFAEVFENISKTRSVLDVLEKIGLGEEVERIYGRPRIRSGKSRWRNRRLRRRVGPLIIVSSSRVGIIKAASGIPGVDVKTPDKVSIIDLAPGGHPGRLTIWTVSALQKMVERVSKYVAG
ncbi:MAG: 50S ribosomal protein L4 [Thermoproteota archaeon]